jgi:hypothetical protein
MRLADERIQPIKHGLQVRGHLDNRGNPTSIAVISETLPG